MKHKLLTTLTVFFTLTGLGTPPLSAAETPGMEIVIEDVEAGKAPEKKPAAKKGRFEEEPEDLTSRHRNCWLCHAKPKTNEDADLTMNTFMKLMQSGKQMDLTKSVGPLKVKLKKKVINHFTGRPYVRKNLICVTCHEKIHRKFGHPIGISTKKIQYIHMSPAYKNYTSQKRLQKINCDICHDVHNDDYYKYLVGIYNEEEVETLCTPCHPEQAVPLPRNQSNIKNPYQDEVDSAAGDKN